MQKILLYFLATRPQFFPAVILPVALGASTAWHSERTFLPVYFFLALLAAIFYHAGMNVLNDYFDFLNGTDNINKNAQTPFTGGTLMIQGGLISPSATMSLGTGLLVAGALIGLYLAYSVGPLLLIIGFFGLFSGILYSAPPVFLAGRGLGEITVGLNFGIMTTLGSYYVQSGSLGLDALFASLPLSFLIIALLYTNQFPDYEADRTVGKRNLVVRLGARRARWGMPVIVALAFLSIIAGVLAGHLPLESLISVLPAILAIQGTKGLIRHYDKGVELVPSIKN